MLRRSPGGSLSTLQTAFEGEDSVQSVTEYLLFLRHVPLFRSMTFPQLHTLWNYSEIGRFHQSDVLFTEGEYGQQLYLIMSGQVHLFKSYGTAEERLIATLGAMDFLGEMGLFEHAPHSVSAVAATETEVLLLPEEAFRDLLQHHPTMVSDLGRALSARIRRATQHKSPRMTIKRPLIQHILVPLDGSSAAEHALAVAMTLATSIEARVTVLHVLEPPAFLRWEETPELEAVLTTHMQHIESAMQQMVEAAADRVRAAGVPCQTLVVTGVPFQVIIDLAQVRQVDLIVLGRYGHTGVSRVLLGGVAERVMQLGPCAVLIVPQAQEVIQDELAEKVPN